MIRKKVIVYTAGTWDLFHKGHLNILKKSKQLGDVLIVGVSSDKLVRAYKSLYPVFSYKDRKCIVKSCKYVDLVIKQNHLIDVATLRKYKIDVVTIGSDWKNRHLDGLEYMKEHGRVVYLRYSKDVSTSEIKKRIIQSSFDIIEASFKRRKKKESSKRNDL